MSNIYEDCIDKWGISPQMMMMQEECAELIVEISHHLRGRKSNVVEEIADVQIMINQMKEIFGKEIVQLEMDRKLERIRKRLNNELG